MNERVGEQSGLGEGLGDSVGLSVIEGPGDGEPVLVPEGLALGEAV